MSPAFPFILIHTARLTLRAPCAGDLDAYALAYEASRPLWKPSLPTIDDSAAASFARILERHEIGMRQGTQLRLLGFLADGRLAVILALSEIVRGALEGAYAGWRTSAPLTGKGLATEGVTALLDLAFAPSPRGLGLHRVQANIMPGNIASIRVAEKTGFRKEGLAQRYLLIDGKWQDHLMFAKVVDEHRHGGNGR
jgi:ribosomal-protein-alanine N-acetyltransferase